MNGCLRSSELVSFPFHPRKLESVNPRVLPFNWSPKCPVSLPFKIEEALCMLSSLQCVAQNTTHAFLDGSGRLLPSSHPHSCLQLFSVAPGERGRGCPRSTRPAFFGSTAPGAPQGSGMRSHRPTPAAPLSLFTPPHSWQCPAQRWPEAQRVRAERGGAFPSGPRPGVLEAGRQS